MFPGWSGIPGVLGYYARGGLVYGSSQDVPGMVRYPRCPRILCQGGSSVRVIPGCSWDGQVSLVS